MDSKAIQLLQEIADGQRKQTALLESYLGRFRFSLRLLLLLMTLTAIGLGFVAYKQQQQSGFLPQPAAPPPQSGYFNPPAIFDPIDIPAAERPAN